MSIKVKAVERKLKFEAGENGAFKYRYVLQPDLYNKLTKNKVIQEAALRSGITRGSISAAWDAIGQVVRAWATEGHAVDVAGLGTMRFGFRSNSVEDVNDVAAGLITSRRVVFVPSSEIKQELKNTSISITCVDRDGNIVKRINSVDEASIEETESELGDESENSTEGGNTNSSEGGDANANGTEGGDVNGSEGGDANGTEGSEGDDQGGASSGDGE